MNKYLLIILALALLVGCKKDHDKDGTQNSTTASAPAYTNSFQIPLSYTNGDTIGHLLINQYIWHPDSPNAISVITARVLPNANITSIEISLNAYYQPIQTGSIPYFPRVYSTDSTSRDSFYINMNDTRKVTAADFVANVTALSINYTPWINAAGLEGNFVQSSYSIRTDSANGYSGNNSLGATVCAGGQFKFIMADSVNQVITGSFINQQTFNGQYQTPFTHLPLKMASFSANAGGAQANIIFVPLHMDSTNRFDTINVTLSKF